MILDDMICDRKHIIMEMTLNRDHAKISISSHTIRNHTNNLPEWFQQDLERWNEFKNKLLQYENKWKRICVNKYCERRLTYDELFDKYFESGIVPHREYEKISTCIINCTPTEIVTEDAWRSFVLWDDPVVLERDGVMREFYPIKLCTHICLKDSVNERAQGVMSQ